MVFDEFTRSDHAKAKRAESMYSFLNRSAWPDAEKWRNIAEDFLNQWPEEDKKDLIGRLKTEDDKQFNSALFELYLNQIFSDLKCKIGVHPDLNNGSDDHPDFLIQHKDEAFYIEGVCCVEKGDNPLINELLDKIDARFKAKEFSLKFKMEGELKSQVKINTIFRFLEENISKVDPVKLLEIHHYDLPEWELPIGDVTFKFTPISRKPEFWNQESDRMICGELYPPIWIDSGKALRNAIKLKAQKYGTPDKPLILGVALNLTDGDFETVFDSLFGKPVVHISRETTEIVEETRDWKGSFFYKDKAVNSKISGILVFPGFTLAGLHQVGVRYYPNPYAKFETPELIKQFSGYDIADEKYKLKSGLEPYQIINFTKYL